MENLQYTDPVEGEEAQDPKVRLIKEQQEISQAREEGTLSDLLQSPDYQEYNTAIDKVLGPLKLSLKNEIDGDLTFGQEELQNLHTSIDGAIDYKATDSIDSPVQQIRAHMILGSAIPIEQQASLLGRMPLFGGNRTSIDQESPEGKVKIEEIQTLIQQIQKVVQKQGEQSETEEKLDSQQAEPEKTPKTQLQVGVTSSREENEGNITETQNGGIKFSFGKEKKAAVEVTGKQIIITDAEGNTTTMKGGQAVVTLSQVSVTLKQLKKEDQEGTTTTTGGSVNFKNIEGTVEVTEVVDAEGKKSKKTTAKVGTTGYTPTSIDF